MDGQVGVAHGRDAAGGPGAEEKGELNLGVGRQVRGDGFETGIEGIFGWPEPFHVQTSIAGCSLYHSGDRLIRCPGGVTIRSRRRRGTLLRGDNVEPRRGRRRLSRISRGDDQLMDSSTTPP